MATVTVIMMVIIATSTTASASIRPSPARAQIVGGKDTRWAANSREKNRTMWAQLFREKVDS
jgi:hypothetical protein